MEELNRDKLKAYFQTGDRPTQAQFAELIDSVIDQMDDGITIDNETGTVSIANALTVEQDGNVIVANALAVGSGASATGTPSVAMGSNTLASGNGATAIGGNATASGDYSTAMGIAVSASGENSIAMGSFTSASNGAIAMGDEIVASGIRAIAMGRGNLASGDYSIAMGRETETTGLYSTTMGFNTIAESYASTAIGQYNGYNIGSGNPDMWNPDDPLFEIGNGENNANRSNALTVFKNGNVNIANALTVGTRLGTTGGFSTVMGNATASGNYAIAMGNQTTASNNNATAMGAQTLASGLTSTAMGFDTEALGTAATAMGSGTRAEGLRATAMGYQTLAFGIAATAMGSGTEALGEAATAMGFETRAQAYASTALGYLNVGEGNANAWDDNDPLFEIGNGSNIAGIRANALTVLKNGRVSISNSLAVGLNEIATNNPDFFSQASGRASFAAGIGTRAESWASTALGRYNVGGGNANVWDDNDPLFEIGNGFDNLSRSNVVTVFKNGSVSIANSLAVGEDANAPYYASAAIGINTTASGLHSIAMGVGATASYVDTIAIGFSTEASGNRSIAMGNGAIAQSRASMAVGQFNVGGGNQISWIGSDPLFEIGNGEDEDHRSNAFTILKNGTIAMGFDTEASGDYSTAMGYQTMASGFRSTAMGVNTIASGTQSTAIGGGGTTASGPYSIAIGNNTTASGSYATAMGTATSALEHYATTMGINTTASGLGATAMGDNTIASGTSATAMGSYSTASGYCSTAMGRYNIGGGDPINWLDTDPLFEIGNGAPGGPPSNALTILKNGNVGIGTTDPGADRLDVQGNGYISGAWNAFDSDYAEYFETQNGKSIPVATAVAMGEHGKIYAAKKGETPIGIVSGSPCVIGNSPKEWPGKYLRDELGQFIIEEYEEDEMIPKIKKTAKTRRKKADSKATDTTAAPQREEIVLDKDGRPVMVKSGKKIKKQRRKLNPEYDESRKYMLRQDRDEWCCIGLLGQLPLRKGQPVAPGWVKLYEISDKADMWLVK